MKKIISVFLSIIMTISTISFFGTTAFASAAHTQAEAVSWAKSQVGNSLDYDNQYGAQCVDFIAFYYQYLGTTTPGGNACKYATNALPEGWCRYNYYNGFIPQPGDIAVWTYMTSNNGHVAIVTSADSSGMCVVDQNGSAGDYDINGVYVGAGKVKEDFYKYTSGTFACVVRPDFDKTPPVLSNVKVSNVGNSRYTVTCTATDETMMGYVEFVTKDADGNIVNTTTKSAPTSGNTYEYLFNNAPKYGNYTTTVTAVDASGNRSASITTKKTYLACKVSKPKISTTNVINGKSVTLSTTTTNTTIYYKTSKNGDYKKYTAPFKLTSTKTVYAKAKRANWKNSDVATKEISVGKLSRPSIKATAKSSASIKITWSKVKNAQGYYIYRATSKDGTYKLVKTITSGSTTSWTNSELKSNKSYYYKARAYCKGRATSSYSYVKSAKTLKSKWKSAAITLLHNMPKYGMTLVDTYSSIELVDLNNDNVPEIINGAVGRGVSAVGVVYYYNGEKYVKAKSPVDDWDAKYPIYPAKNSNDERKYISYDFQSESSVRDSFDMVLEGYNTVWLCEESYSQSYKFSSHKLTYTTLIDLREYVMDAADGDETAVDTYVSKMNAFKKKYTIDKSSKYLVADFLCGSMYNYDTDSGQLKAYQKIITKTKAENIVNKYVEGKHSYSIN